MRFVFCAYEKTENGYDRVATFDKKETAREYANREAALCSKEENRDAEFDVWRQAVYESIEEADSDMPSVLIKER